MLEYQQVYDFLQNVDYDFPVPLSHKTTLQALAEKYLLHGTLCCISADGQISAMVAGYTDHTIDNTGYISLVAVRAAFRGKGYASKLIRDFLGIAQNKGLKAVHVYTHKSNTAALGMYSALGFVPFHPSSEPRPDDIHFIYEFRIHDFDIEKELDNPP